jgi:hypothetical protein
MEGDVLNVEYGCFTNYRNACAAVDDQAQLEVRHFDSLRVRSRQEHGFPQKRSISRYVNIPLATNAAASEERPEVQGQEYVLMELCGQVVEVSANNAGVVCRNICEHYR